MEKKGKSFLELVFEVVRRTIPIVVLALIVTVVALVVSTSLFSIVFIVLWWLLSFWTVQKGLEVVPENWSFMFSIFGDYQEEWKEGLHWRFPWFNITNIDGEVFLGEQSMPLYLGDDSSAGGAIVDFKDESAAVRLFFYFQIVDSYKATYFPVDLMTMLEETADAAVRSFLSLYAVEEANELKASFELSVISTSTKVQRDSRGSAMPNGVTQNDVEKSTFYKTLVSWGIEPKAFVFTDIEMPQRIIDQRKRILEANMDLSVSKINVKKESELAKAQLIKAEADKKTTIKLMTGQAVGTERLSEAMAKQIEELVEKGLSPEKAANYVLGLTKAEAMKVAEKMTWIENSNQAASGAAFGAGFNQNS